MILSKHEVSKRFLISSVKGLSTAFIVFSLSFIFLVDALAMPNEDSLNQSVNFASEPQYTNYAKKGSYENETQFSEVPAWHYYDMFGNKIMDGFYMYGLSKSRNSISIGGQDNVALHPLFLRWLNGLMQVGDLHDDAGILAMIGDRIKTEFTPFTLKQSLYSGARFDAFYKPVSLSFVTNRISNTGTYGMIVDQSTQSPDGLADWLTGLHGKGKIGELGNVGATYVNIHHEASKDYSNPYSGVSSDTSIKKIYTGLSLYGLDLNFKNDKAQAYAEFSRSQEFLDGSFLPKGGNVAALNGRYDISDILRLGGEFYSIGSRYQTNFTCPFHKAGDQAVANLQSGSMGRYQYSLVEDNDDKDEFPENGRSRYYYYTMTAQQGDPDGTIPENYDKNKNGIWDFDEDFLSYECDPADSRILFDRNNNGIPDEVEDDAYPDYPYVPSYYLPGERYYRFDDFDNKWEVKRADSMTHKGLGGIHLYGRYKLLPELELTLGGVFDRSQEETFQKQYDTNGVPVKEIFDFEHSTNLYLLAHYKKDIARDQSITIDNYFRKVNDNIPNHTQNFSVDKDNGNVTYTTVIDELDYRDMFADALRAEFSLFRNRGFNYTGAGKFEFQKHLAHPEFNYPDKNITSLALVNKCEYIFLLPFFKDIFLIPKYKNVWENKSYGPRVESGNAFDAKYDVKYRGNNMTNALYLVCEWKMTEKTAFTGGLQLKTFNDLFDSGENYLEPCGSIQLMIKDRYAGMAVALTIGYSRWAYLYGDRERPFHNSLNNPHRVSNNIDAHEVFIKVHAGM
jgi:hypothetical protein